MATVRLDAVYIGQVGAAGIYRVDLGQSGFSTIGAITLQDDKVFSGGTGSASGLDLDYVKISNIVTADAATAINLTEEPVLDFGSGGVVFQAGFQTPLGPNDPPEWNANLLGTSGANVYDPSKATLGILDSNELCLGEGGQVTFLFKSGLSASGRYFYFADSGGQDLASVLVSDTGAPVPTDFSIIGTAGNDTIRLGVGGNLHLQFAETTVFGRRGDDKIYGAFGDDKLYGENGKDGLSGGGGDDWLSGGSSNDRMSGGTGRDVFIFDKTLGTSKTDRKVNFDTIDDFNSKFDSIWLDNAVFKKIGSGSLSKQKQMSKSFFKAGSEAKDKNDYILYDKKTGVLSYDADGSGAKAEVEFAHLKKGLSLTYKDFFVI